MTDKFKKRVISHLKREGWSIKYNAPYPVNLFSVRPHSHIKKAYCVRAHGHLSHKEQKALYNYGKQTGLHVIYIHEVADRELEFIRLYPKNRKMEAV